MIFVVTSERSVKDIIMEIPNKKKYPDKVKIKMYKKSLWQIIASMDEEARDAIMRNIQSHADVLQT